MTSEIIQFAFTFIGAVVVLSYINYKVQESIASIIQKFKSNKQ